MLHGQSHASIGANRFSLGTARRRFGSVLYKRRSYRSTVVFRVSLVFDWPFRNSATLKIHTGNYGYRLMTKIPFLQKPDRRIDPSALYSVPWPWRISSFHSPTYFVPLGIIRGCLALRGRRLYTRRGTSFHWASSGCIAR
jgi:hypothetical protein